LYQLKGLFMERKSLKELAALKKRNFGDGKEK
jgi:hypothetical protein